MTTNIAIVHVNCLRGPSFRLWLPLFLLWIPAILLAPFILLALIVACLISGVPFWRSIATFLALLASLPGTDVQVASEGNRVLVRICRGMVMNTDRRVILALIAMGRIRPAEAERLLTAWDESLETAWIWRSAW